MTEQNRPLRVAIVGAGPAGIYAADAILPVCVTGTMEWAATVMLTTPEGTIAIPFHFEVAGR